MNIKELKQALKLFHAAKVTPLIIGRHGTGKSEGVMQYAAENGYTAYPIFCGQISDPGDLMGLPDITTDKHGKLTEFAPPILLPRNPEEKAIIIFDEVNRADRHVINALFQLVLCGQYGSYKMPKDCMIVAIANPPTDEYTVNDISDSAFTDRFCHIQYDFDAKAWFEYAKDAGDKIGAAFNAANPEFLIAPGTAFDLKYVKPSPRSNSMLARLENAGLTDSSLYEEVASGLIGTEAAVARRLFIQDNFNRVKLDDVLKGKGLDRLKGAEDQISLVLTEIEQRYEGNEKDLTKKQVKNMEAFYKLVPYDQFLAHFRALYPNAPALFRAFANNETIRDHVKSLKAA